MMIRRALAVLVSVALILAQVPAWAQEVRVMPYGSATITAGQTEAPFDVIVNGDTAVEPDEGYTVTVEAPGVSTTQAAATGTIINDDGTAAPSLSVTGPSGSVEKGSQATFTITRAGDTSSADRVRWAVVPVAGDAGADEDNFPAVWADEFTGSSIGDLWCVSGTAGATPSTCPTIPSQPLNGTWDASLVDVAGGSLSLGILESAGAWTSAQVYSKQAFQGGLLRYSITLPAGAGGAHSVWRSPEADIYGENRSGKIVDVRYTGSTSGNRDKEWRAAIQYSGATDATAPEITDRLVSASSWAGTAHTGETRWIGDDDAAQLTFSVDGAVVWAPPSSAWPDTPEWQQSTVDEDGTPIVVTWPAGGGASPIDQPFRIVLESGVAGVGDDECSGEASCPAIGLSGAAVALDWIRYFQYPTGETVLQPGGDRATVSLTTAANSESGDRQFKLVLVSADSAVISAAAGEATATIVDSGTTPTNPGEETYALDFGKGAGGFTDQFGVTWQSGNSFVTGGTEIADTTTTGGSWTTDLYDPPTMRAGYVTVSNKCPEDGDFPAISSFNGKDVKFEWPTDRVCSAPFNPSDMSVNGQNLVGTNNPGARIWSVGGHFTTGATFKPVAGNGGGLIAFNNYGPDSELFIEGAYIDSNGSCTDTLRWYGCIGCNANNRATVTVQNTILTGTDQCVPGGHGDTPHAQTGAWADARFQNVVMQPRFQGSFGPHRTNGHGFYSLELDHAWYREDPNGRSAHQPGGGVYIYFMGSGADLPPPGGVSMDNVYVWSQYNRNPQRNKVYLQPGSFDSSNCAVYSAAQRASVGAGLTGTWCWGEPPGGTFVPEDKVGLNYDRSFFTGSAPITIANAKVPRLDTTRLTGATMNIEIPVDTTRGSSRILTMGFSAREETAAGQRVFDISGATTVQGVDIYAAAGGRDTETTISKNVVVPSDGIIRLALTGDTGLAQINWLTISRPTIGVTLNKSTYAEGETITATFRREGPAETAATMGWRLSGRGNAPASGSDFVGPTTGTATFGGGVTQVTQTRQIAIDATAEPEEGFEWALTGGSGADIAPGAGVANGTISASSGTGNGGGGQECPDDTGATVKTVRIASETTVLLRKAALMTGPGLFRHLNTCDTASTVVHGEAPATDPKGTAPENPTPFIRVETPAVPSRTTTTDVFRFDQCSTDMTTCSPVRVELKITGK